MSTRSIPRLALILIALAALTVPGLSAASAGTSAVMAKKKAKPIVGEVTDLGGSKKLSIRLANGSLHKLEEGDKLRLGNKVVMGKGVHATLRLKRPKGVSAEASLVDLKPAGGAKHNVSLNRKGGATIVVITPA